MKPVVFLSHSKSDRAIVERIAADLRFARIDVWYDDWEIPPGESFRPQIFEEGIPKCDLFFVYLTKSSATSYWVSRELDGAFIHDAEVRGGFLALFVDSDVTRNSLPLDIRAVNSPVLNEDRYHESLYKLIARAWEAGKQRQLRAASDGFELDRLRLEKRVSELEAQIARSQASGGTQTDATIERLHARIFSVDDRQLSLDELFRHLAPRIALGPELARIGERILELTNVGSWPKMKDVYGYTLADFVGPLLIHRVVRIQPPAGDWNEYYYLTDLGAAVAERLA